jgi:RNA polymerase primary sigma factor
VVSSSPTSATPGWWRHAAPGHVAQYEERLGLTATLERSDDAVADLLVPYFGGVCFRYGFEQAIADGVCARPRVAFVGVPLSVEERAEYVATEQRLVGARQHLRLVRDMPLDPFGDFLAAVAHLAEHDAGPNGRAAREYLDAFSKRRQIVAQSSGRGCSVTRPAISDAHGALLFTETVRGANHAINRLTRSSPSSSSRFHGATAGNIPADLRRASSTSSRRRVCSTRASTCPTPTSASS